MESREATMIINEVCNDYVAVIFVHVHSMLILENPLIPRL